MTSEAAKTIIASLFKSSEGHSLKAWMRHFDRNHDMSISRLEFTYGMAQLDYHGSHELNELFHAIDTDRSGEIALEEIDTVAARLWAKFRRWCAVEFVDNKEMVSKISDGGATINQRQFTEGCERLGWSGGSLDTVFACLDRDDSGIIEISDLKWFEAAKKTHVRKALAKQRSLKAQDAAQEERQKTLNTVTSFKRYLKQKYSSYLRAWRCAIDLDGSMTVQKHELFKMCHESSWSGDVRILWQGLDRDDSGITSLEEIDLRTAEQLAKFKDCMTSKFGSVNQAFQAFDVQKKGKLNVSEFIVSCKKHGFEDADKSLFLGLALRDKYLLEKDVHFLQKWRPAPYLVCAPNEQAAEDFKACLLRLYDCYVRAWRVCLDKDSSNKVGWQEFVAATAKVRFKGDVAGAWRFFDDDLSGFITLREIDAEASEALLAFKLWVDDEFGCAKSAFDAFDTDNSREMSKTEFRQACRTFGFAGDSKALFDALDVDRQGQISHNEISFIDGWELPVEMMNADLDNSKPVSRNRRPVQRALTSHQDLPPRICELAEPKARPTTTDRPVSTDRPSSSIFRPGTSDAATASCSRPASSPRLQEASLSRMRAESLRQRILQQPMIEPINENTELWEDATCAPDFASMKTQTIALRTRTLELLGKVEDCDKDLVSLRATTAPGGVAMRAVLDSAALWRGWS